MSNAIDLLKPVYFYQTPVDAFQTWNGSTQVNGTPLEAFSCRGCNQNLASSNPASQYQRQKLIQNTVRVPASLYTMNIAALSAYQKPSDNPLLVEQAGATYLTQARTNWNQMSDRARPSVQRATIPTGTNCSLNRRHTSSTSSRPGCQTPGGVGVDIKHNSYDRYLNRLKGKSVLRRGPIPPNYGAPIPYNRAYPIEGGKVVKTGIVNGCACPDDQGKKELKERVYKSPLNAIEDNIRSVSYVYHVGDTVWALDGEMYYKGVITAINGDLYTVHLETGADIEVPVSSLLIYFDCNCDPTSQLSLTDLVLDNVALGFAEANIYCSLFSTATNQGFI